MDPVEMKLIMMICSLAECSEEVAREAYSKTQDVLLAVDSILFQTQLPKPLKRKREDITPEEEYLAEVRQIMKNFDEEADKRIRNVPTSDLPVCMEEDETPDPLEETALQSSCFQQCQIPSMEGVDQTQETEYH